MKKSQNQSSVLNKSIIAIAFFLLSFCFINANNLQITNVNRGGAGNDEITFNIAWENSWWVDGAPSNYDAVWVFIKFRECGTTNEWSHALLSTNMPDHSFSAGIEAATPITVTDRFGDGTGHNTGVMIKRSDKAIGHITNQTVTLKIVGSSNAVDFDDETEFDIKVFGIEMVYIPEGPFFAGDEVSNRTIHKPGTNPYQPLHITSESLPGTPNIAAQRSGISTVYTHTLGDDFPKGYNAFYIMKYEITQGQYVDFLNTLTATQITNRGYMLNQYNHRIAHNGDEYFVSDGDGDRAKGYLSWDDFTAYMDWAALRPISELEFEKACRGPLNPVFNEYAWGSGNDATITPVTQIANGPAGIEISATDNANCNIAYPTSGSYDIYGVSGSHVWKHESGASTSNPASRSPVAVGMFARTEPFDRIGTGATYYGVMEMSGNVTEQCVSINHGSASNQPSPFTGIWGNGQLDSDGFHTVGDWQISGHLNRYIYRGGSYIHTQARASVSDRTDEGRTNTTTRNHNVGGRGVR